MYIYIYVPFASMRSGALCGTGLPVAGELVGPTSSDSPFQRSTLNPQPQEKEGLGFGLRLGFLVLSSFERYHEGMYKVSQQTWVRVITTFMFAELSLTSTHLIYHSSRHVCDR